MNFKKKFLAVGTLTTGDGLKTLKKKSPQVDYVELRIDMLLRDGASVEQIQKAMSESKTPIILTARSEDEGGEYSYKKGQREALMLELLPKAAAVDLELRHLQKMKRVESLVRKKSKTLILSVHEFSKAGMTPQKLMFWKRKLLASPAKILKIATQTDHLEQLQDLCSLLCESKKEMQKKRKYWALMGMGKFGALSRFICPVLGSKLVYGWLDAPLFSSQLSIVEIQEALTIL